MESDFAPASILLLYRIISSTVLKCCWMHVKRRYCRLIAVSESCRSMSEHVGACRSMSEHVGDVGVMSESCRRHVGGIRRGVGDMSEEYDVGLDDESYK
jgi:hypothetical protein